MNRVCTVRLIVNDIITNDTMNRIKWVIILQIIYHVIQI